MAKHATVGRWAVAAAEATNLKLIACKSGRIMLQGYKRSNGAVTDINIKTTDRNICQRYA